MFVLSTLVAVWRRDWRLVISPVEGCWFGPGSVSEDGENRIYLREFSWIDGGREVAGKGEGVSRRTPGFWHEYWSPCVSQERLGPAVVTTASKSQARITKFSGLQSGPYIQLTLQGSCPLNSVVRLPTILTDLVLPSLLWQRKRGHDSSVILSLLLTCCPQWVMYGYTLLFQGAGSVTP